MLEKKFHQQILSTNLWQPEEKILVAVSGGVDSMVLLHLLKNLPEGLRPEISVAHINHQLREISAEEEAFVMKYCLDNHLPIFTTSWLQGKTIKKILNKKRVIFVMIFLMKLWKKNRLKN